MSEVRTDQGVSWSLFLEALESDLCDIQGGTTREGVHMGVMAGTVDLVRCGFAGVEPGAGSVSVDPRLLPQLATCGTRCSWGGAGSTLAWRTDF